MSRLLRIALGILVIFAAAFLALALAISAMSPAARARDLGQWGDVDAEIAIWFSTLMQPDNPQKSCCGTADAYWADNVAIGPHGETVAIITDDRADEPLHRHHVPIGTPIVVPNNKIKYDKGNPTGHVVIFLDFENDVYCYVMNGGV